MRLQIIAAALALSVLGLGCAGSGSASPVYTPKIEVSVLQETITLQAGATVMLEGVVGGADPDHAQLLWTIDSGAGTLTPKGPAGLDLHCEFKAPASPGTTVVKAASKSYPSAYKNIALTITAP